MFFFVTLALCVGVPVGYYYAYWNYQKYVVVEQIQQHKFPESRLIDTEVWISRGMTGNWCWVTAFVTFETQSTFEEVEEWYRTHPEGLRRFEDGRGLDLLVDNDVGNLKYRVSYQKWIEALFCPGPDVSMPR